MTKIEINEEILIEFRDSIKDFKPVFGNRNDILIAMDLKRLEMKSCTNAKKNELRSTIVARINNK